MPHRLVSCSSPDKPSDMGDGSGYYSSPEDIDLIRLRENESYSGFSFVSRRRSIQTDVPGKSSFSFCKSPFRANKNLWRIKQNNVYSTRDESDHTDSTPVIRSRNTFESSVCGIHLCSENGKHEMIVAP